MKNKLLLVLSLFSCINLFAQVLFEENVIYEGSGPNLNEDVELIDINNDGIKDLFGRGNKGMVFYLGLETGYAPPPANGRN